MPQLCQLSLSQNRLTDAGLVMLQPLLTGLLSSRLTHLGYGSGLTDEGVQVLVALIANGHLANLLFLGLRHNHISDTGATTLAATLSGGGVLPKLEELDLRENAIGDKGAKALANAIRGGGARALKTLQVQGNAYGEAGGTEALQLACMTRNVALNPQVTMLAANGTRDGLILIKCYTCSANFGVPPGTTMAHCPTCQTVNGVPWDAALAGHNF
eukprot:368615-Prymnesium_polylepis.1